MPNNEPVTLGEVARKLDTVVAAVDNVARRVEDRPSWEDIKRIEDSWRTFVALEQQRVTDLENWVTWAGRIVLGAILLAVLGVVLVGGPAL